jgi:hypothetical protein
LDESFFVPDSLVPNELNETQLLDLSCDEKNMSQSLSFSVTVSLYLSFLLEGGT